jgi:hypothetical protein
MESAAESEQKNRRMAVATKTPEGAFFCPEAEMALSIAKK